METEQTTSFFPTIGTPQVKERIVDVELPSLGKDGEPFIAQLRQRSNFSEFFKSSDEKFDKIARSMSQMYKAHVSEMTLRLADRIAGMWVSPSKQGGLMPNRDDLVKLSVEDADAFRLLVEALNEPANQLEDDIEKLESDAKEDFTVAEADTLGTS
jgi:hypothetical protein